MAESQIHIALAGNPNCGKTTLFNLITGQNGYVGNWPGVTVEKKQAPLSADKSVIITDLPGIYSLSPYSPEEQVSRDYLMSGEADVVVQVVDATNLERNLYLALQVIETGLPVVVALNMADLVKKNGDTIDVARLEKALGCPVVMVSALKNNGVDALIDKAKTTAATKGSGQRHAFDSAIEDVLQHIESQLPASVAANRRRYYAVKMFERDSDAASAIKLTDTAAQKIEALIAQCEADCDDDAESIITGERYAVIAHIIDECLHRAPAKMSTSEKIDRIVTNRWLGLPIFAAIMFGVYYLAISTFGTSMTDWVNDNLFGDGWDFFGAAMPSVPALFEGWLSAAGASDMVISLVCDGIVAGVGAVLGFIPQMFVLFVLLSFLEDCGYMARVAFVMDRIFRRFGLSGKSFIPMLVSTGCGVPGVLATKTIENEKDRRMTIMTTTMIPCGAKLPIIALVFGALAGGDYEATWWVAPVFYFLGLFAIILSCIILKKFRAFSGEVAPFIMELPQYHLPTVKNVLLSMWERVRSYVVKAGTIIFLSSMVIWFLLNFGFYEGSFGLLDPEVDDYIQYSLMAGLGNLLAWIFAPLGFGNWESTVTSITGLVAKENVVATVGVITSLGEEIGETDPSLWASFAAMLGGSSAAIMAFCAFNLLCAPCFAAIGTIRRQMMSAKWTWAAIGYMCAFAWCVGLMIYQFGGLIAGEIAFGPFTALAIVVAAGMLYLLFRPAAKPKRAGRLEAARKNA